MHYRRHSIRAANSCRTGRKCSRTCCTEVRATNVEVLTAAMIRPSAPCTGTASERIPSSTSSSLMLKPCRFASRTIPANRSEEHTSELQSLMRISYAVFCLKKKKKQMTLKNHQQPNHQHYNTKKQLKTHKI